MGSYSEDYEFALLQAEEEKRVLLEKIEELALENKGLKVAVRVSNKRWGNEECAKLEALEQARICEMEKQEALKDASRWRAQCEIARTCERHAQEALEKSMNETSALARQCQDLEQERAVMMEFFKRS